jgi:hypothetical protein
MALFKPSKASELVLVADHAEVTADTTIKLYKVPTARKLRVRKVEYVNPTGLAADGSNYFVVAAKNGSTVIASKSSAAAEFAADTVTELTQSATDSDMVLDADEELSLSLDETGTATLPAGKLIVHAWLI